jgi:antibiotic biosynthesis monooxygenase (ABM) superfamily enzyme
MARYVSNVELGGSMDVATPSPVATALSTAVSTKTAASTKTNENEPAEKQSLLSEADHVSGIINYSVNASAKQAYSEWLKGIKKELQNFPGYLYSDVVQSDASADGSIPVSVVLRFERAHDLKLWEASDERAFWLADAKKQGIFSGTHAIHVQDASKAVSWDDPNLSAAPPRKPLPPPKWRCEAGIGAPLRVYALASSWRVRTFMMTDVTSASHT